jgi:hypothetical protein
MKKSRGGSLQVVQPRVSQTKNNFQSNNVISHQRKTPNSKRQAISDTCEVSGDLLRDALLQLRNNMIL